MRSTREGMVCPHRIIDDIGSGFGLGIILGSLWNFMKGVYSSPSKERLWGGIMLAKKRAPISGGNFAAWMGLFGFWQCALLYATGHDSHVNQVIAGGLTGGMVNMRGGFHYARRGLISGSIFIGVFNVIEIFMTKSQYKNDFTMKHIQIRYRNLLEMERIKKFRPNLVTCSEEELDVMKNELLEDIDKYNMGAMLQ